MLRKLLKKLLGENFTENNLKLLKINYLIIILLFIFSGVMLKFVPSEIPMQWNADGSVNYSLPSIIGIWLGPVILLVVNLSLTKQKRINILNTAVIVCVSIVIAGLYLSLI